MVAPARDVRKPQLLERAFALLALFDEERPEWTTTEAARAVRLPIPTAHRILAVLEDEGFLARNGDKRFTLGLAALQLGRRAHAVVNLQRLAKPLLEHLATVTDEVTLLIELSPSRTTAMCRMRFDASERLGLSVEPGMEMPLYAGASQKALLAFMPAEIVEGILSGQLKPLCRATITQPERLRQQLDDVRRRGWAISFEETDEDVWGVALPIVNADGQAVATVALAGPRNRLEPRHIRHHLTELHVAAETMASRIGCSVPPLDLTPANCRSYASAA
jgi:IclR family transcriptional regulator, KDG regulon repressor